MTATLSSAHLFSLIAFHAVMETTQNSESQSLENSPVPSAILGGHFCGEALPGAAAVTLEDSIKKVLITKVLGSVKSFNITEECHFINGDDIKEEILTSALLLCPKNPGTLT